MAAGKKPNRAICIFSLRAFVLLSGAIPSEDTVKKPRHRSGGFQNRDPSMDGTLVAVICRYRGDMRRWQAVPLRQAGPSGLRSKTLKNAPADGMGDILTLIVLSLPHRKATPWKREKRISIRRQGMSFCQWYKNSPARFVRLPAPSIQGAMTSSNCFRIWFATDRLWSSPPTTGFLSLAAILINSQRGG